MPDFPLPQGNPQEPLAPPHISISNNPIEIEAESFTPHVAETAGLTLAHDALRTIHPSIRSKLQVFEHLQTHPDLLEEALKLEKCIPVWFGDHTISFQAGSLVVDIQSGFAPSASQKARDEKAFEASTTYPVRTTWRLREPDFVRGLARFDKVQPEVVGFKYPRGAIEDIIRTATRPAGVDIGIIRYSRSFNHHNGLNLILLTVAAKDGLESQLKSWRQDLEDKLGKEGVKTGILLKVENVKQDSADQLMPHADRFGVIRDFSTLPDLATLVLGAARPPITDADRAPLPELDVTDLTTMPAVAIDPAGIKDPEDAIYEEPLSNGNRLMVVAVAVNRRFKVGSPQGTYAELAGESIYGRLGSIPLFPEEFSWNEFALVQGEPRYTLVMGMEITPDRKVVKKQLTLARIVNHRQLSFDEADEIIDGKADPLRDRLLSMRSLAVLIKKRPLENVSFQVADEANDGMMIVTNCSIASKYIFAAEMEETEHPILFHVHAGYTDDRKEEFLKDVQALGVSVAPEDFNDSLRFRELIDRLEEQHATELIEQMLDTVFEKGRFQRENWGHKYLKVDAYAPLKTRLLAGWMNQQQAMAEILNEPGLTPEVIQHFEERVNKAHRNNDYNTARMRIFEEVLAHRKEVGKQFTATVERVYANEVWITVPSYYRWGSIYKHPNNKAVGNLKVGDSITVNMDGYDVRKDRFRFRLKK